MIMVRLMNFTYSYSRKFSSFHDSQEPPKRPKSAIPLKGILKNNTSVTNSVSKNNNSMNPSTTPSLSRMAINSQSGLRIVLTPVQRQTRSNH